MLTPEHGTQLAVSVGDATTSKDVATDPTATAGAPKADQRALASATASPESTYYTVTGVVDRDTIKISMNGREETLRLIGIDTPETVDPRKPVQCFGREASDKAKELLAGKKMAQFDLAVDGGAA